MSKKDKKELQRLRGLVKSYQRNALDAYIDGNYASYAGWTAEAMRINDKVMTMTGFKGRKSSRTKTIYVPVAR